MKLSSSGVGFYLCGETKLFRDAFHMWPAHFFELGCFMYLFVESDWFEPGILGLLVVGLVGGDLGKS